MNGGADLGGMMGFGPVIEEANEPNFHDQWESRVLGTVVAIGACGQWNLDQSRFARESLPPADYMRFPYYRIWLEALQKLMLERKMITTDELTAGRAALAPVPIKATLRPENVEAALNAGGPCNRPERGKPIFSPGDQVRTVNMHPESHTRLPRYARSKSGTISKVLGFHVFPDSNARGEGENPQWLYQVKFSARELWGKDKNPRDSVTLDLWEPYFEQA